MRARVCASLLALAFCQSCCTQALWKGIEPTRDTAWFSATAVSEQDLIARGVEYRKCDDPLLGSGYLVKKGRLEMFKGWAIVTLATPVTVAIDGVAITIYGVLTSPDLLLDIFLR